MADVTIYIDRLGGTSETAASIKTKYESNADTNAYTDAEKALLANQSGANTGDQDLSSLASKSNVLERDNTDVYTPTTDYHPATKKYVDDNAGVGGGTMATTTFTPYSTITSTDGQAAVEELKDELDAAVIGVGAGASPVSRTASGGETNWDVGTTITASHKLFVNNDFLVEGTDYTKSGSVFTFTGYTSTAGNIQKYFPDVAVPTTYNADEVDDSATTNKFVTAADVTKLGHISVTQAVDLDTMESNIATNNAKVGVTTELKPTDIDTLAELNAIITDATLVDTTDARFSDARTPTAHASSHTNGTDDIQSATNAQKGLATAAHITAIEANTAKTGVTTEISNLSEDTTPQLGGELDFNGHSVGGDAQTATGDGTTTIDWGGGNFFHFQFGAFNEVFTFTAPTKAGTFILKLVQDSVGSRTATFPATVKWSGGTAPTLTTTATTGTDIITFYFDGTNYFAVEVLDFS
jgi:hypothetical protein